MTATTKQRIATHMRHMMCQSTKLQFSVKALTGMLAYLERSLKLYETRSNKEVTAA